MAINAHYFLPFPSEDRTAWVIGLGASEGRVFSAFEPPRSYALASLYVAIHTAIVRHVCYDPCIPDAARATTISGTSSPVRRRS